MSGVVLSVLRSGVSPPSFIAHFDDSERSAETQAEEIYRRTTQGNPMRYDRVSDREAVIGFVVQDGSAVYDIGEVC